MIISKVYIKNFRSINEVKLELSNYSVIFGKNNEGKSNIMRAIYRGWTLLEDFSNHNHNAVRLRHNKNGFKIRTRGNLISNTSKEVEDDITKDSDDKNNLIQIGYYFDLSDEEYIEINKSMNSKTKITKKIYVEIQYDDSLFYKCRVKLNSNGNFLSSPKNILASIIFIQKKFDIDYIPSIRTEETATEIVQNAVKERLKDLTLRDEYNEAINLINQLQDQELKK
ncbi:AAA family ATPase [Staphylococcus xylosus]|uniref:AAA family ATPase n=4 Tax=Bacteria TaxID=2 RepID=UPI00403E4417